jgi:hypothetical protein
VISHRIWTNRLMRLLIVEDDTLLGDALAAGLRQLGHAVDWFGDGAKACGPRHSMRSCWTSACPAATAWSGCDAGANAA